MKEKKATNYYLMILSRLIRTRNIYLFRIFVKNVRQSIM